MKTAYHVPVGDHEIPKRGDTLQSNIGKRTERTWIILQVRELKPKFCEHMGCETRRFKLWAERWWEIEPETRQALYRSAERQGGQIAHAFYRFPRKKKATFEQHMRRAA